MSQGSLSARVQDHFQSLADPRRLRVVYPLINVVTIAVCAVIGGADDFVSIAEFGRLKRKWFAKFLDLSAGIPSHDRFNAILAAIKPAEFEKCLLGWITALHEITGGQVVAIDGKTLRRSYDTASGKAAIHMVSAWATANSISLGQVVVDAKSNEITAIPVLLELLDLHGALVTIDAIGCQKAIAKKIVAGGGDYVLVVKANQERLLSDIQETVGRALDGELPAAKVRNSTTTDQGHGRVEKRSCVVIEDLAGIRDRKQWPHLTTVGMCYRERTIDGEMTTEAHYFIGSRRMGARRYAQALRSHWGIENNLHTHQPRL